MDVEPSFTPASIFVATKEQISCDLQDESVILNFPDGIYYGLNSVAARIWTLIQKPCSFEKILDDLMEEFEVDRSRCEYDLVTFLRDGIEKNLILVQDE